MSIAFSNFGDSSEEFDPIDSADRNSALSELFNQLMGFDLLPDGFLYQAVRLCTDRRKCTLQARLSENDIRARLTAWTADDIRDCEIAVINPHDHLVSDVQRHQTDTQRAMEEAIRKSAQPTPLAIELALQRNEDLARFLLESGTGLPAIREYGLGSLFDQSSGCSIRPFTILSKGRREIITIPQQTSLIDAVGLIEPLCDDPSLLSIVRLDAVPQIIHH